MANTLRKPASAYVMKIGGSDTNDGLTKETAKKTVQAGLAAATISLVIGAGQYSENINASPGKTFYSDGAVILDGQARTLTFAMLGSTNTGTPSVASLFIRNYRVLLSNINVAVFGGDSISTETKCTFDGCLLEYLLSNDRAYFSQCVFYGCDETGLQFGIAKSYTDCVIWNNTFSATHFIDSVLCQDAILYFQGTAANFKNSIIRGKVAFDFAGVISGDAVRNIPLAYDASSPSYTPGAPTIVSEYPGATTACSSADPLFLDESRKVFGYVQPGSPLLGAGSIVGQNIAKVKTGTLMLMGGSVFPPSGFAGLTGTNDLTGNGTARSAIIGDGLRRRLTTMDAVANLRFDSDIAAGSPGNDMSLYAGDGLPGAKRPARLSFRARWTLGANTNPATWTSNGKPAGAYSLLQYSGPDKEEIKVDVYGNGNAETDFDPNTGIHIEYTYLQIEAVVNTGVGGTE